MICFNIIHAEAHRAAARFNDPAVWRACVTQRLLALAGFGAIGPVCVGAPVVGVPAED